MRILRAIINRVCYLQPARTLLVGAAPAQCALTLRQAVKPSHQRLHLRNLFTDGRRYYFTALELPASG